MEAILDTDRGANRLSAPHGDSVVDPRLPGALRLGWMFWRQPLQLNRLLLNVGIDPRLSLFQMVGNGQLRRNATTRAYVWRSAWILLLTNCACLLGLWLASIFGAPIDLTKAAFGVAFGVAVGVALGVAGHVAFGVANGVAIGVALGLALGVASGVALGVAVGVAVGVAFGVAIGVASGVARGVALGLAFGVVRSAALGLALGVAGSVAFGVEGDVAVGVAFLVAAGAGYVCSSLRVGSWLVEETITLLLAWRIRTHPSSAIELTRWLPHRHHDLIYLPLFGLRGFIVDAARSEATLGEKLILEAAASVGQKGIARESLLELRCRLLEEVAIKRDWSRLEEATIPFFAGSYSQFVAGESSANESAVVVLPFFRALAIDLRAAQANPIHAEARRALTRAQAGLRSWLEQQINEPPRVRVRAREVERVRTTVRTWIYAADEIDTELRHRELEEPQVPNPYRAGAVLRPREQGGENAVFVGRRDLAEQIAKDLAGAKTEPIFVFGQRRMGKSSFLAHLRIWLGTGTRIIEINFQELSGKEDYKREPWVWVTSEVAKSKALPAPPKFHGWSPALEWLEDVDRSIASDERILVAIDEVEGLEAGIRRGWGNVEFLDFLRAAGDRLRRIRFLLLSAWTLQRLGAHWASRLISVIPRRVNYLDDASARKLITAPIPGFPDIYPEGGVDRILKLTYRQPWLIQVVCSKICDKLLDSGPDGKPRRKADAQILDDALNGVLLDCVLFQDLWNERSNEEQEVLRRAARGGSMELSSVQPQLRDTVRSLLDEELLVRDGEAIGVAIPLFATWIKREELDP